MFRKNPQKENLLHVNDVFQVRILLMGSASEPPLCVLTLLLMIWFVEVINAFISSLGVTRSDNKHHPEKLFHFARVQFGNDCPRGMCVLRPLKVVLTNLPKGKTIDVECPLFPTNPEKGSYKVPLTNIVYIDLTDFRIEANKVTLL